MISTACAWAGWAEPSRDYRGAFCLGADKSRWDAPTAALSAKLDGAPACTVA